MVVKKNILIFLFFCCFILSSCNQNKLNEECENNVEVTKIDAQNKIETTSYELESYEYENSKINIKYPQMTKLEDGSIQQSINSIISNEALKLVEEIESDNNVIVYDAEYYIKRFDNKILSIQFIGYISSKGAPYPMFMTYTVNIDVRNGQLLVLTDYIEIDEKMVDLYNNGDLTLVNSFQNEAFIGLSDDEILSMFKNSHMYLTQDALGLIVFVPHAAGDYAELEIKYQNLEEIICDNDEWGKWKVK
jgi:hypothetical protein